MSGHDPAMEQAYCVVTLEVISVLPNEPKFLIAWIMLFALSTIKYTLLLDVLPHPRLLRRKIFANASSIFLGALALTYALHYPTKTYADAHPTVMTVMLVLFLLASLYYFFVNPLYRPDRGER